MKSIPKEINSAKVILYSPIDQRHQHTGNCRQIVNGVPMGAAAGLAICKYDGEDSYYLFGCDENWQAMTDTWHQTIDDAMKQAEFEYAGINATWQKAESDV